MAEKIRYTRKDLKGPDEFISTFSRTLSWVRDNAAKVGAAAAVVVVLVGGVLGAQAYFRWQESKATRDLWPHLNRAREVLLSPAGADEEKLARLEQFLTAFIAMHPRADSTVYARYYLGSISFLRKNYDLSATQFRAARDSAKENEVMRFLLTQALAQALEAKGDYAAAAESYRDAAAAAAGELRTQAQMGQARTLELAGRKTEAVALYRQILTEAPEGGMRELIEIKLAQAG